VDGAIGRGADQPAPGPCVEQADDAVVEAEHPAPVRRQAEGIDAGGAHAPPRVLVGLRPRGQPRIHAQPADQYEREHEPRHAAAPPDEHREPTGGEDHAGGPDDPVMAGAADDQEQRADGEKDWAGLPHPPTVYSRV
jgi:hypothetical protein